ncbi:MAG: HD domain-containing protein [Firmicutes bacterium]|nr:HD domain-containing protein [Bacillota bacterium]
MKITTEQMGVLRSLVSGHDTVRYSILHEEVYQTVENHTNRMLAIAPVVANIVGFDFDYYDVCAFILAHDLVELGMKQDITALEQAQQAEMKKKKEEYEAKAKIELGEKYGAWLSELLNEYEKQESESARFVKWLDKYEANRHMLEIDLFAEIGLINFAVNMGNLIKATNRLPIMKEFTLKHMDEELRKVWERNDSLDEFLELRNRIV